MHALNMWRHYLMGKKFLWKTDNMSLKYLFEQLDLNVKKARWLAFLSEYHFKLKHIKGKENKIVDALREWAHMICNASNGIINFNLIKHLFSFHSRKIHNIVNTNSNSWFHKNIQVVHNIIELLIITRKIPLDDRWEWWGRPIEASFHLLLKFSSSFPKAWPKVYLSTN